MPEIKSNKAGFSLGFTIQIEDYEPVKIAAWNETEYANEISEEDKGKLDIELAKKVMSRICLLSEDCITKIQEIKEKIISELSE